MCAASSRYLVTGGAGFIGSHLVEALIQHGNPVNVLDRINPDKATNLRTVLEQTNYLQGDIRNLDTVREAVSKVNVIFHEAAVASVQESIDDPQTTVDVNISGTLNVLSAAAEAGCRRVVIASSAAVYGDSPEKRKSEDQSPAPLSPYAISKLVDEQLAAFFARERTLETVCLRYFNVYGPRQDPSSPYSGVISRFVDMASSGQSATIYGDGQQTRDFINVADVLQANLSAAQIPGISGLVCNVASGKATSVAQLWDTITATLGVDLHPEHQPTRPGDIRDSLADVRLARESLGFESKMPLSDGLTAMLADKLLLPATNTSTEGALAGGEETDSGQNARGSFNR